MKRSKHMKNPILATLAIALVITAMVLGLSLTGCDNGNSTETHTHTWAWQHNATQHWQECTANDGAKTTPANHTGDPCSVCGYESAAPADDQPTISSFGAAPASITVPAENTVQLTCTAASKDGSAVKSVKWTVEDKPALANPTIENADTAAATVNNMEVAGTYKFKLVVTGNNDATKTEYVTVSAGLYYEVGFVAFTSGATLDFSPVDPLPKGVTYTLSDGTTTWNSTSGFVVNASSYENSTTPTFTQIFYLNGEEVARQVIRARVLNSLFANLRDANNVNLDPNAIPSVTLKWPADMSLPITHAITVPAIATVSNPLNFGAVSALSGWNSDFPSADVTYILTLDNV